MNTSGNTRGISIGRAARLLAATLAAATLIAGAASADAPATPTTAASPEYVARDHGPQGHMAELHRIDPSRDPGLPAT